MKIQQHEREERKRERKHERKKERKKVNGARESGRKEGLIIMMGVGRVRGFWTITKSLTDSLTDT